MPPYASVLSRSSPAPFVSVLEQDLQLSPLSEFSRPPQIGEVARLFASRSLAEWDAILAPADCCYQAILDLSEVPEHPQARARHDRATRAVHRRAVSGLG